MRAAALASALDLPLHGDPERELARLAPLAHAGADELTFVTGRRHLTALQGSSAGLVIVPPALLEHSPADALVAEDPYAAYAAASWLLTPERAAVPPSAVIDIGAQVADDASVGPNAVVGANSRIGAAARIGAGCLIGEQVDIGARTRLFAGVTVNDDVRLGSDCRVQSGAVIGAEAFGFASASTGWQAIHQTGGVRIGDRVHIAGSTTIGARCLIAGSCNINGHIELADGVVITATAFVPHTIREPGSYGSSMPLQPARAWRRTFAAIGRLDELVKRVRALERRATGPSTSRESEP